MVAVVMPTFTEQENFEAGVIEFVGIV